MDTIKNGFWTFVSEVKTSFLEGEKTSVEVQREIYGDPYEDSNNPMRLKDYISWASQYKQNTPMSPEPLDFGMYYEYHKYREDMAARARFEKSNEYKKYVAEWESSDTSREPNSIDSFVWKVPEEHIELGPFKWPEHTESTEPSEAPHENA